MAERKTNTIEYAFEGNTLSLQQATKQANSLLTASVKKLKQYQDGMLTEGQQRQVKAIRKLIAQMRKAAKDEQNLTTDKKRHTITAGKEALKQARKFSNQTEKIRSEGLKAEAARIDKELELTSISGQESARQHASFLDEYADRMQQVLSPEAYDEIKRAVRDYTLVSQDSTSTQEELASATERLQDTYKGYSETLQTSVRAQQAAAKGMLSFSSIIQQTKVHIEATIKSFSFWMTLLRKGFQYVKRGVKDASAYIESLNFLNVTIGETNDKFREFIDLQQKALGLDPTEINESAATFYSFGNAIGFSKSQIDVTAESLTKLAADLASLRNTNLDEMTTALRSALAGHTKPLMRFGIAVHDASVEEWLLSQGLQKSMKSMSEASQAAARYAFILDKTQTAHGDLARTIESPANQLKILGVQFKLLFQNLGGIVLPVVTPVVRALNLLLQPINALLKAMTNLSSKAITASIGEGVDAFEDLEDASSSAGQGLASFDSLNMTGSSGGGGALSGMDDDIAKMIKGYDNMAKVTTPLVDVFEKIGEAAAPLFNLLNEPSDAFFSMLTTLTPVLDAIATPLGYIMDGLAWLFNTILTPIISVVHTLTSNVWLLVTALGSLAALMIVTNWSQFLAVLPKIAAGMKSVTTSILTNIKAFVTWIATQIKAAAQAIVTTFRNWALAGSYWKIAVAAIAAAGVLAAVVGAIVITATAAAESRANKNMKSGYDVPKMAKGGVVTGPTLALVGEGRYNEAVMPLGNSPQFREMKTEIANEVVNRNMTAPTSSSNGDVKVYVTIGGNQFDAFVYKVVNDSNKRVNGIGLDKISQRVARL